MVFIDVEKAYDRVPSVLIQWDLNKRNFLRGYIAIIKDMYNGALMSVRTTCGETNEFLVTIGLHQGSTLNLYLFALIIDELAAIIHEEIYWCLLFAHHIVLVDKLRDGINAKLER